ncbi:hypothetical protein ACGFI9_27960 [Micromonospora sp. NPDC048930]|uniref:hypothetical protein n=1 Tax=Micromonospora sp. NPDC048930 TaxID=3364261 RepID=UPI003721881F
MAIIVGLVFVLLAVEPRRPAPQPLTSWRPATEDEKRQHDDEQRQREADHLSEVLFQQWQQREVGAGLERIRRAPAFPAR